MWESPTNSSVLKKTTLPRAICRSLLAAALLAGNLLTIQAQTAPRLPPSRQPARPSGPASSSGSATYGGGGSTYGAASSTVATTTSMAVLDGTRKLGIGDLVSFRVVEDREPPVSLVVGDSGEMEAPYIGRVKAAGKTCKELAFSIKSALEVDYYHRATVIIGLDLVNPNARGRVYVSGEVMTQGAQDLPAKEEFTASKAIANAGGPGKFANLRKIQILRKDASGKTTTILFDLKKFQNNQGEDVVLEPNDTINVRANVITLGS